MGSAAKSEINRLFQYGLSGLTAVLVRDTDALTTDGSPASSPEELLLRAIDAQDHYTFGHSRRAAHYTENLAVELGLSPLQCFEVGLAGLLHDVGKVGVPREILAQTFRLNPRQQEVLRRHPEMSAEIIRYFDFASPAVAEAVRCHHERVDGHGYPQGLSWRSIPLVARILAVADAWDAMIVARPYRQALTRERAEAELRASAGSQLDPWLVRVFLGLTWI